MEKDEVFRLGMKTSQNPFVYNAPVRGEDFFNREETIKTILTQTATGKSQGTVWVVGERHLLWLLFIPIVKILKPVANFTEVFTKV
jgi:hypothetical protein